ncbi:TadE/TadG family type IV pilus assembly protein [Aliagarivorans taiwanensis]|uniref:TadE/TadG family type IV pilus assembly protein n=1 Tax=Aliagarivorans taiwanensis TaxID=561966 RepID=UPI00040D9441|nr:pilus assembly protein TadG-related protein [Aliagarivorans taiwanensis]
MRAIHSLKRQQGAAAIILALSLVPLFGLTFLALEGTRYVQKQARLHDALESTALALASANNAGMDEDTVERLGQTYVNAYVRNQSSVVSLGVERLEGEEEETEQQDAFAYVQYSISAQTSHRSWFSSEVIPSFARNMNLQSGSAARNYLEEFEPLGLDIVFVADFSGSMMNDGHGPDSSGKYPLEYLKDAVEAISEMVLQPNIDPPLDEDGEPIYNRIGYVPYNNRTQEIVAGQRLCVSQTRYDNNLHPYGGRAYEQIDWSKWALVDQYRVRNCANSASACSDNALPTPVESRREQAITIANVISSTNQVSWMVSLEPPNYLDATATINDMFVPKHLPGSELQTTFDGTGDHRRFFGSGYVHVCNSPFWTIDLTTDLEDITPAWQEMDITNARGSTSVYQGILRSAQVMDQGRQQAEDTGRMEAYNKRQKMIMILTDGRETPYPQSNSVFKQLVDAGMCQAIRERFNAEDNPIYLGVIGINFGASNQVDYSNCVGSDNIQDVYNLDELLEEITRMIQRGTRRNGVSRIFKPA